MLSRVESGERVLSGDELQAVLTAIGTPATGRIADDLIRDWQFLPRPPLDHSDQDVLWEAEIVRRELVRLRSSQILVARSSGE